MRKEPFLLLILVVLFAANCRQFAPAFQQSDIVKVELVTVQHPLLGGVVQRKELEKQHYEPLYQALTTATERGVTKMFTCFEIQVQTSDGKRFSFRTNGKTFFAPQNDVLYELRSKENLIEKYWNEKAICDASVDDEKRK